jgi:hypothetical protein
VASTGKRLRRHVKAAALTCKQRQIKFIEKSFTQTIDTLMPISKMRSLNGASGV